MRTHRKVPIASGPGFLKLHATDFGLGDGMRENDQHCGRDMRTSVRAYQSSNHLPSFSTMPLFPQISVSLRGAYFVVHNCVKCSLRMASRKRQDQAQHDGRDESRLTVRPS